MAFDLRKIWQLLQGTSLRDEYEIPVSEGQASGDTKRYNISQLKAHIWAFVQQQIGQISQGPQGPSGTAGQQGQPGPTGNKGDKGDRGEAGLKGDFGPQGPIGIQGPKGDKGDLGALGEQGLQGIQGEVGPIGEQGPQGEQGVQGEQGETGKGQIEIIPFDVEELTDFEIDFSNHNRLTLFGSYPEIEWWTFDGSDDEGNQIESYQGSHYVKSVLNGVLVKATIQVSSIGYIVIRAGNDMPEENPGSGFSEKIPFTRDMESLYIDFTINARLANFGPQPYIQIYHVIPAEGGHNESLAYSPITGYFTNNVLTSIGIKTGYNDGYVLLKTTPNMIVPEQGQQGIQGEKGDQGEQGERGPQGTQGLQGIQGIKGEKGSPYLEVIAFKDVTDSGYEIDFTINNRQQLFGAYPEIEYWRTDENDENNQYNQFIGYSATKVDGVITKITIDIYGSGNLILRAGHDIPQKNEFAGGQYFEKIPFTRDMQILEIDFTINNRSANFGLYPHLETYVIPALTTNTEELSVGAYNRYLKNGALSSITFYPGYQTGYILIKSRADLFIPNPDTEAGHYEVIPFEGSSNSFEVDFTINNRGKLFGLYPYVEMWQETYPTGSYTHIPSQYDKIMVDGLISKLSFPPTYYGLGYVIIKSSHDLSIPVPPVAALDHFEIIPFSSLTDNPYGGKTVDFTLNNRQELFGLHPYFEVVQTYDGNEMTWRGQGEKIIENGAIKRLNIYPDPTSEGYVLLKSSPSVLIPSPEPEKLINIPADSDYTIGRIGEQTMIIVPNNTDGITRTITFPDPALHPAKTLTFFLNENWTAQTNIWNLVVTGGSKLIDPRGDVLFITPTEKIASFAVVNSKPDLFIFQSTGKNWLAINNRYSNNPSV